MSVSRCKKCRKGLFTICDTTAFTTECDFCGYLDLNDRVARFGLPKKLHFPPTIDPPRKPLEWLSEIKDAKSILAINKDQISIDSVALKALLIKIGQILIADENVHRFRKTLFEWVDLNIDEENIQARDSFIDKIYSFSEQCKKEIQEFGNKYATYERKLRLLKHLNHLNDDAFCNSCHGYTEILLGKDDFHQCRWCNGTGISWSYWMQVRHWNRRQYIFRVED